MNSHRLIRNPLNLEGCALLMVIIIFIVAFYYLKTTSALNSWILVCMLLILCFICTLGLIRLFDFLKNSTPPQ